MNAAARALLGGQAKVRSILEERRRIKDGRVEKKSTSTSKDTNSLSPMVKKKKSVNGYMFFRLTMQHVFHEYPQADRSPFIREMWEKEPHKPIWTLIAKVWTHIRDYSGGFDSTIQFAVAAIEETGLTQPDLWLSTYNMALVRDNTGSVTLQQNRAPTAIPEPRQLTDVELLFGVIKRGLPVKNPVDLLDKLVKSQRHYMTVTDRNVPFGEVDLNFNDAINNVPVQVGSWFSQVDMTHNFFERGVGIVETSVLGSLRIDDSLLSMTGDHTVGGFEFDTTTDHLLDPLIDTLDTNAVANTSQVLDMGLPAHWDAFNEQVTEEDHMIDNEPEDPEDYPLNVDFLDANNYWNL
ncbi:hypothetical protein KVR01_003766 [Diaporthe batatas]|uniref:uncharacterized protein n=1 Tax=Diaporthe batatas TaxID=748121 RepID=UPI001D04EB8D|nr:uncharacterized protein KVR01_003766 [Diaporthe batatas]KAG8168077.1 hypothetical protein KVR01_003766 [Diaporthe batatas]